MTESEDEFVNVVCSRCDKDLFILELLCVEDWKYLCHSCDAPYCKDCYMLLKKRRTQSNRLFEYNIRDPGYRETCLNYNCQRFSCLFVCNYCEYKDEQGEFGHPYEIRKNLFKDAFINKENFNHLNIY